MVIQNRLMKFVMVSNWILFAAVSIIGILVASPHMAAGIIAGGLIAVISFYVLYRTLKRALTPPHVASPATVLIKYYIRFIVVGIILFLLVSNQLVNPLGLFIGLSVVVASIVLGTIREFTKLLHKEAI